MKNFLTMLVWVLALGTSFAQAPNSFNFQAVARNASNEVLSGQTIGIKVAIIQDNASGSEVFSETHQATTDNLGHFSIMIGEGTPVTATLADVDWSNHTHFVRIDIDFNGGNSYSATQIQQLLSVPYSLHAATSEIAESAERATKADRAGLADKAALALRADKADRATVADTALVARAVIGGQNSNDGDSDPNNEIQNLTLTTIPDGGISGTPKYEIEISNGNKIELPYTNWEKFSFSPSSPPQLAAVGTKFPFFVEGSLNAGTIGTDSITIGNTSVIKSHITPKKFQFIKSRKPVGWSITPDAITYEHRLPSTPHNVRMTKEDLSFVNDAGWITSFFGTENNRSGKLFLFPGGGVQSFFRAYLEDNKQPTLVLSNGRQRSISNIVTPDGIGVANYLGVNGKYNARITYYDNSNKNHGFMAVYDSFGKSQAGMYVNGAGQGVVFGDSKTFRMEHPEDPEKEIVYVSLEGPEAAIYERGTAELTNGSCEITLSEHFQLVKGDNDITVQLTPLDANSKGLSVVKKANGSFVVKELFSGKGNYKFDWEIKSVRSGRENHKVIVPKGEFN